MHSEADLIRKFKSIERLLFGAKFDGEKEAASEALNRVKQRLRELEESDPPVEYKFTLTNMWSRRLLTALLRRYEIEPYRYYRQRYTTVMAKVPAGFVDSILWPEFTKFDEILRGHIDEITSDIISKAVFKDTSEVVVKNGKLLN